MYTWSYINKHVQFDALDCFLVITDTDGIMPQVIITKSFKMDVTEQELEAEAEREMAIALQTYEQSLLVSNSEE